MAASAASYFGLLQLYGLAVDLRVVLEAIDAPAAATGAGVGAGAGAASSTQVGPPARPQSPAFPCMGMHGVTCGVGCGTAGTLCGRRAGGEPWRRGHRLACGVSGTPPAAQACGYGVDGALQPLCQVDATLVQGSNVRATHYLSRPGISIPRVEAHELALVSAHGVWRTGPSWRETSFRRSLPRKPPC